jgi:hypothetical protein
MATDTPTRSLINLSANPARRSRITALRRAFDAALKDPALKDPALIAEADKSKIEIDPLLGEEVAELVRQVSATPAAWSPACVPRWRRSSFS